MPNAPKKTDEHARARMRGAVKADVWALAQFLNKERPQNLLTPDFHQPICRELHGSPYQKNLWLLQRGSMKTSLITVIRNVQRLLINPEIRILIGSNKADNAAAMLAELKGHLANPWLIWLFPEILFTDPTHQAEKWTESVIIVKRRARPRPKEGTVETIGIGGEITSKHYDHITYDDLVGQENSQTRDQVLTTIAWWQKSQGLTVPHTTQDIVGTPWHPDDLYMWMQERTRRREMAIGVYRVPCWVPDDERGEDVPGKGRMRATLPEVWPIAKLLEIKKDQGSDVFAAQRELDPIDDETAVFPRKKAIIKSRDAQPPLETLWLAMTVDPAISMNKWADYTALAVCGFDLDNKMHVLDLRRGRWSEGTTVDELYDAFARWPGIRAIGFEAIGFAKIYRREVTRQGETRGTFLPIMTLERDTKVHKNTRIRALVPFWEHGDIVLYDDLRALDDFLEEAQRFRPYREATHDDMLDALADQMQLRARPKKGDETPEWLINDPVLLERQRAEIAIQAAREEQGLAPLDHASLRVASNIREHYRRADEARQAAALGAQIDEFSGV